ncbi:hypothetical protein ILUMI_11622 [Ignelater luminosus]|uniref:HTH CENPB-type domain-containing protein n=1 Tax=Ignelater luminosus TaxID=2038154 RepID=A0A8K0CZZ3_IGNLU|nr:hypothetical protein ILUMI_11622 [Ignelater luminosus]
MDKSERTTSKLGRLIPNNGGSSEKKRHTLVLICQKAHPGYETLPRDEGRYKRTFSETQEKEFADYLYDLNNRAFGLTSLECGKLAYEFAKHKNIQHQFNKKAKAAGKDWLISFIQRQKISLWKPESISLRRLVGYNKTESKQPFVLSPMSVKRVAKVTSGERERTFFPRYELLNQYSPSSDAMAHSTFNPDVFDDADFAPSMVSERDHPNTHKIYQQASRKSCEEKFSLSDNEPLNVYSDCGTNFVGASRQLDMMKSATESEGIPWHFNPPASPNCKGLCETGIKAVKTYFYRRVPVKKRNESENKLGKMLDRLAASIDNLVDNQTKKLDRVESSIEKLTQNVVLVKIVQIAESERNKCKSKSDKDKSGDERCSKLGERANSSK